MERFKKKKFIIPMILFFGLQAFMYWFLKLFQSNTTTLFIGLDYKIPFWGYFVYIYNMFYPFFIVAFGYLFLKDEKGFYKSIIAGIIGFLICDIIFLVFPTVMIRPTYPLYDPLTNLVLKITYMFDTPALNCFPSIHCLFSFQVMISFILAENVSKSKKTIFIIGASLICISTLLIKQHYVMDLVSALIIAVIINFIVRKLHIYEKISKKLKLS